jgi:hypothetical protein
MRRVYRGLFAAILVYTLTAAGLGVGQTDPATTGSPVVQLIYSQAELDQLLAPIALYPDDLLTDVLIASTYPLEVVKAQRWLQEHPGLSGGALATALQSESWDPSVKALAAFPAIVAMMNDQLDWTQKLGDAFLAQQPEVMDTVQGLRRMAQAAGTLQTNGQQQVLAEDDAVGIEPVNPDWIYVPYYNPSIVYGPWWWPDYPPFFWVPPPIYGPPYFVGAAIAFGVGIPIVDGFHHRTRPDWHHRHIVIGPGPGHPGAGRPVGPVVWQHDPLHRGGVPYRDERTRNRLVGTLPGNVGQRRDFRGFDGGGAVSSGVARPGGVLPLQPNRAVAPTLPQTVMRPILHPSGPLVQEPRYRVQEFSNRGHSSLSVQPAPPSAPAERAVPAPSGNMGNAGERKTR